jgi:hypothetical protein
MWSDRPASKAFEPAKAGAFIRRQLSNGGGDPFDFHVA